MGYSIKVFETGYDTAFPAGIAFDFWHMADEEIYSPFTFTLIQGNNHNILFDCGIDPSNPFAAAKIAFEHDQGCQTPQAILETVGLTPDDIDIVILSHLHWDHISGLPFFANAHFYIQKDELEGWDRAIQSTSFPLTHKSVVDTNSLTLLHQLKNEGRLTLLNGDVADLLPGLSIMSTKGHSFAQSVVLLKGSNDIPYAIIGDVAMRPESFIGNSIFPCYLPNLKFAVGTIEDIVASYDKIMDWVGNDTSRIIMSHDGTRFTLPHKVTISSLGLHTCEVC